MPGSKSAQALWMSLVMLVAIVLVNTCAAQQEAVLHSFGHGTDGAGPETELVIDSAGNLYGTTLIGGIHDNCGGGHGCGTVFQLSPRQDGAWTETVLYSFGNGTDGQNPSAGLILDMSGNLYGTTAAGGIHSKGTVFELSPREGGGWTETVLHSFGSGTDGASPYATLTFDGAGNLYGTTLDGGIHGRGTVFELSPRQGGEWSETVLHSFGSGTDGSQPYGELVFDAGGDLYGTTTGGGSTGIGGTVFELSPRQGGGWSETIIHSFGNGADGEGPTAGPIFDGSGSLYGTTAGGGIHGGGTVFELSPRQGGGWTETVIHSFGNGTDGKAPYGGLIFDSSSGNLYGTTNQGGIHYCADFGESCGTVFQLSPREGGGWTETVLHSFGKGPDGAFPYSGLIRDASGHLYGTTFYGGIRGFGTAFEITP